MGRNKVRSKALRSFHALEIPYNKRKSFSYQLQFRKIDISEYSIDRRVN
jgi:hypothetical protein